MAENKMNEVAQLLGLELEEEFRIESYDSKYKLTRDGLRFWSVPLQDWVLSSIIGELLSGERKIIKLPKPILDDVENPKISKFKKEWFVYFNANYSELAQRLNAGSALSDEDKKTLIEGLNSFKSTF